MSTQPHIKIYSSAWCPFCIRAKQLLDSKGVQYEELVVDSKPALRKEMTELCGRTSVPQIWIGETHVGGCDDLYALEQGKKLDALLTN
ncbi:glutaredoxin 3 [Reinekea thalattae]|uniref:Glutaredoxin n=1 Tax=Reinekea thalattae TaxID=2593301 RepID=A0A5C8ZAE5_9GAMM|nr:glutaredoxin 3 [Reinekea thalattae]TXR54141.1 glutaredoxin 3 [Reinekea thalattae]